MRRAGVTLRAHIRNSSVRSGTAGPAVARGRNDRRARARSAANPARGSAPQAVARLGAGVLEIPDQIAERSTQTLPTGDQHVIAARDPVLRQVQPRHLLEPAPYPIALHGVADAARGREADADPVVVVATVADLEDEAGLDDLDTALGTQERRAPLQPLDDRPRRLRPRGAFCPWRGGAARSGGHRRSPSVPESRAAACGRSGWVERCASP